MALAVTTVSMHYSKVKLQ